MYIQVTRTQVQCTKVIYIIIIIMLHVYVTCTHVHMYIYVYMYIYMCTTCVYEGLFMYLAFFYFGKKHFKIYVVK